MFDPNQKLSQTGKMELKTPLLALLVLLLPLAVQGKQKSITVLPAKTAPNIDGRLTDEIWQHTDFFTDFTQQSPKPLSVPGERTEVAAAYNHSFLFVAIKCHVSPNGKISSRLTRRDRDDDFDKVEILLSPSNDGKTGFSFIVNPDGMQQDGTWSNDTSFDRNWDAIWEVKTQQFDSHWTAEFAIPLDQLRFTPHTRYFGFQIKRWIAHRHELVVFNPKDKDDPGEVSRGGRLLGTAAISPKLPFSMMPEVYATYITKSSGLESTSPPGLQMGAGGYIKTGVSPGWTLDLAIAPDFGEVEVDKASVNLTNIEIVHPEKRPFFLENQQLFATPIQLFYSRRLGQAPAAPDMADNESALYGPLYTPILWATKLSGTNSRGIFVGALHVLSQPTRFTIQNDITGDLHPVESTPWTHDGVLRIGKQFSGGNNIGLLATSHVPDSHTDEAYTGGLDWNLFFQKKKYAIKGQVAASAVQVGDTNEYDKGAAVWSWLGRQGGKHFRTSVSYDFRSDQFEPNQLGYLDRNDIHKVAYHAQFLINEQRRYVYELYTGTQIYLDWNTNGVNLQKFGVAYLNIKWRNRMWTEVGAYGKLTAFDDMEFADGPSLKRMKGGGTWTNITTAADKPLGLHFYGNLGTDDTGYFYILQPTFVLRAGRVELELSTKLIRSKKRESYADEVETDTAENTASEYILAKRNLIEIDTGLKSTIVLFENFTAELNSQLLTTKAHYHDYRELLPNSAVVPTTYNDSQDFAQTVLVLQALLRYEFRPQSVLYLSYTRRGEGEVLNQPHTLSNTYRTTDRHAEQRFLIKASYHF